MNIAVVDYGTGNLHSLVRALEHGGAMVRIEADLRRAIEADGVILPGAGAFNPIAAQLAPASDAFHEAVRAGKPCLGIGVGLQLLVESGTNPEGAGLCVFGGRIRPLQARRIPHVGWNEVDMMDDPIFRGLDRLVVYYGHCNAVQPADESDVIGWTTYGTDRFPAAARRGNVWAVQFRPDKSGPAGLRILRNFLSRVEA